ncbi:unnamed protein product [Closterium sp. NIES-53]
MSASPPSVGGECALSTDVLEDRQEEFECLAAAVPRFASMLLAPKGDPDAPHIPTPHSYAEAITGPYSSQLQGAVDAEMGSWKSTGTYVDERQGVDYFQTFSPTPKMTTLWVLLHVAAQRDYELHSLDFSTVFLQGSLHEEIWLRRPPGFTGTFPAGTQWSLRRPVYGLRQAPREWHDTLRTTLAALGFAPSTADPSLFLRTDTSLPPFYVLVYVDELVFATAHTEAMTLVKSELQKRHTCTGLGPSALRLPVLLATAHSSVYQPLALSSTFGRFRRAEWSVKEDVGCLIKSGMGLVLGGRGPVVLTGHADASWVDNSATQRSTQGYTFGLGSGSVSWWSTRSSAVLSSSCDAEIYAGAMAAQELRWLTYLLTNLGEQPRSPPVLYVDNKPMIALCQEHKLEHRTKHIVLRYFLARELQQRGQLRFAYVATRANTADVFTKALSSGDHQRFGTVLGLEVAAAMVVVEALAVARASSTLRRPRRSVSGTLSTGGGGGGFSCTYVIRTGDRTGQPCGGPHATQRCFARLNDAWRVQFPQATELPRWVDLLKKGIDIHALDFDAILTAMYVMSTSGEGAEYLCVPPDPGIRTSASAAPGTRVSATPSAGEAAALGACASAPPGTESTTALHTFTLDSGASRCFFRDRTALKPLARPVAVSLADPSGGPVIATSSTVLPCPAVPSGTLSGLHLPSFSTNLVAGCALQDGGVHQFTPAYERVTHCTCARTGRHLATFTRQPGSDLYTLTTGSPQATFLIVVIASAVLLSAPSRVSAAGIRPANATAPAKATAPANATAYAKGVAAGAIGSANATTPVAATARQSKSSGLGKNSTCAYYGNYTANPYFGKGLTVKLPPAIFGQRCGACYKVICANDTKHCRSGKATVTVRVIGATTTEKEISLSPVSWSKIVQGSDATPVGITYKRTNCHSTAGSAVRVRSNSTAENFNIQMVGLAGPGTLKAVEISADGKKWAKLTRDGSKAIWGIKGKEAKEVVGAKKAVSVRLTAGHTLEEITLDKVLPAGWKPQTLYSSKTNFKKLMAEAK